MNVAQRGQAHARHAAPLLDVVLAAAMKADHGQANVLIGAGHLGPGPRGQA